MTVTMFLAGDLLGKVITRRAMLSFKVAVAV